MEKIKSNLINDMNIINKDYDEAYRLFFFLMQLDHIFSEGGINKVEEIIQRHLKFKTEYEE